MYYPRRAPLLSLPHVPLSLHGCPGRPLSPVQDLIRGERRKIIREGAAQRSAREQAATRRLLRVLRSELLTVECPGERDVVRWPVGHVFFQSHRKAGDD